MSMKIVFFTGLFLFAALANTVIGQSRPKGSFQVHVGIPVNLTNESFKGFMQGLVTTSAHYQYTLRGGLSFAGGVSYQYFTINQFKTPQKATGGMNSPTAWGSIGHEKLHSSAFGTDVGLKGGYSHVLFASDLLEAEGTRFNEVPSLFFEPTASIIMFGEDMAAFKFTVGCVIQDLGFRPEYMGMTTNGGYDPANFSKMTTSLNFSFGYVHYFRMH
jgi:hypothetical protein